MTRQGIARLIALLQASYPTRRLTPEMLSLAALAYYEHLEDIPEDVGLKAVRIAIREDDSSYRDWPSAGQIRAIAERLLGKRISGYEAARLAASRIRAVPDGGDYAYRFDSTGLAQPVAKALREALRVFGLRRFAEMDEDKRMMLFAQFYDKISKEIREREAANKLTVRPDKKQALLSKAPSTIQEERS